MQLPPALDLGFGRTSLGATRGMGEVLSSAPAWPDLAPSAGPALQPVPALPRPPEPTRIAPAAPRAASPAPAPAPARAPVPAPSVARTPPPIHRPPPPPAAPRDPHALRTLHTPPPARPPAPRPPSSHGGPSSQSAPASAPSNAPRAWPPGLTTEAAPTRAEVGKPPTYGIPERILEVEAPPHSPAPPRPPPRMQPPRPTRPSGEPTVAPGKAVLWILATVLLLLRGCDGCNGDSPNPSRPYRTPDAPSPTGRPATSRRPLSTEERVRLQQLRRDHENGERLTPAEQRELTELERRERIPMAPR